MLLRNDFVHHMSYELRSPLTNIIGFAQLLGDGSVGPLNSKQREYALRALDPSPQASKPYGKDGQRRVNWRLLQTRSVLRGTVPNQRLVAAHANAPWMTSKQKRRPNYAWCSP